MNRLVVFLKTFFTMSVMLPVLCALAAWDYVRGAGGFSGGGMAGALVGLLVTFGAAFIFVVLGLSFGLSFAGLPLLPTLAALYFGPIATFSLWATFNDKR